MGAMVAERFLLLQDPRMVPDHKVPMRNCTNWLRLAVKILICSTFCLAAQVAQATMTLSWYAGPTVYAPNGLLAPAGGTVTAGLSVQVSVRPLGSPSTVNSLELREVVGSSYVARAYQACPVTY